MFCLMQEVLLKLFSYGFSWDRAELTNFDFDKISQLTHRPDKTLTQQIRYRGSLVNGYFGCSSYYVADAGVG